MIHPNSEGNLCIQKFSIQQFWLFNVAFLLKNIISKCKQSRLMLSHIIILFWLNFTYDLHNILIFINVTLNVFLLFSYFETYINIHKPILTHIMFSRNISINIISIESRCDMNRIFQFYYNKQNKYFHCEKIIYWIIPVLI